MALLADNIALLNFGGSGNYNRTDIEDNDVEISNSGSWNKDRGHRSRGKSHKRGRKGHGKY